jgi:hypothetical protein
MRLKKRFAQPRAHGAGSDAANGAGAAAAVLLEAEQLLRDGRVVDALDRLAAANRERRDRAIEIRMLDLRHRAASSLPTGPGRAPWPPAYDDPFPDVVGRVPEVGCADLSAEVMGGAVAHHGALLVRGMLDAEQTARGFDAVRRTEAQRDRTDDDPNDDSWYRPFPAGPAGEVRPRVRRDGGTWLADSPAATAVLLDLLTSSGVISAVADHLGERPLFSLQKSTLRHSLPINNFTGWHQDGSFLGPDVRTMNVWVALTRCGSDRPTPGLEVVPRRVEEILPTEGGLGRIAIDATLVEKVAADTPPVRPAFEPGDGLLFDQRFLHRTYLHADMTEARYAVECWLFAPSHASTDYVPFLV